MSPQSKNKHFEVSFLLHLFLTSASGNRLWMHWVQRKKRATFLQCWWCADPALKTGPQRVAPPEGKGGKGNSSMGTRQAEAILPMATRWQSGPTGLPGPALTTKSPLFTRLISQTAFLRTSQSPFSSPNASGNALIITPIKIITSFHVHHHPKQRKIFFFFFFFFFFLLFRAAPAAYVSSQARG